MHRPRNLRREGPLLRLVASAVLLTCLGTAACSVSTDTDRAGLATPGSTASSLPEEDAETMSQEEYAVLDQSQPMTAASLRAALLFTASDSAQRFRVVGTRGQAPGSEVVIRDGVASADVATGEGFLLTGRGAVGDNYLRLPELAAPRVGVEDVDDLPLASLRFDEYRVKDGMLWRSIENPVDSWPGRAWLGTSAAGLVYERDGVTVPRAVDADYYLDTIRRAIIGGDGQRVTEQQPTGQRRVHVELDGEVMATMMGDDFGRLDIRPDEVLQATIDVSELGSVAFVDVDASPWAEQARLTLAFAKTPDRGPNWECLDRRLFLAVEEETELDALGETEAVLIAAQNIAAGTPVQDLAAAPSEWFIERRIPIDTLCKRAGTAAQDEGRPTSIDDLVDRTREVVFRGFTAGQIVNGGDFGILTSQVLIAIAEIPAGTTVAELTEAPTTWLSARATPHDEKAPEAIATLAELQALDTSAQLQRVVEPGQQLLATWFDSPE